MIRDSSKVACTCAEVSPLATVGHAHPQHGWLLASLSCTYPSLLQSLRSTYALVVGVCKVCVLLVFEFTAHRAFSAYRYSLPHHSL